ncbi:hypothetical protein HPB50_028239 [Hyalomma asiaticum]|nr:hypothetical protein HPB50_028239 [Hyalomma asiaticum]
MRHVRLSRFEPGLARLPCANVSRRFDSSAWRQGIPSLFYCSVKPEYEAREHQPLTESKLTDIISHLRRVPEENGPSLEEDLLEKLEPEKARRVLAEYDILISFLEHQAAFRHLREDLHYFIYYENPNDDGDCYYPSSTTVPLADLCEGLSTMALGAKMAVIAGGETGEPAYGAGGSVSMQRNKANAAGDCDTSPCRYLPEVDTDDAVKIWCSRSQPSQMTQNVPGAFLVEVELARSSSSDSGHDGLDDEKQGEEWSSEVRDDNGDRLRVDRPVGYAASVGAPPKVLRGHRRHRGNARL